MIGRTSVSAIAMLLLAGSAASSAEDGALPKPPANGEMGFVVSAFVNPIVFDAEACPEGPAKKVREAYLDTLTPEERARLLVKENEPELTKRWQATVFGPGGANLCSQPEMFNRPLLPTVQSKRGVGLDLDGGGSDPESCPHEEFASPDGLTSVDNQEYRVMGCTLEWRGKTGTGSDQQSGMRQFLASGEWTQVILLRGVDSLEDDRHVEVIYANTPDRPIADSKGAFLRNASYTISDTPPRHRNALKGRIDKGVLTTEPANIALTQTWGQGGARDIRGNRSKFDYRKGRVRLVFKPDGSMEGVVGGYRPLFDVFQSPAFGGAGSALSAGIDCASYLATLRKYADGLRDPVTKQCTAVSSAMRITAIPAFVNDVPSEVAGR